MTLYALTRNQNPELALMALVCRALDAAPGPGEIYFAVGSALFSGLMGLPLLVFELARHDALDWLWSQFLTLKCVSSAA